MLGLPRIDMRHLIDVLIGIGFGLLMYGWADVRYGTQTNTHPNENAVGIGSGLFAYGVARRLDRHR